MKYVGTSLKVENKQESPQNIFCTKNIFKTLTTVHTGFLISIWTKLVLCCVVFFESITAKLEFYINIRVI